MNKSVSDETRSLPQEIQTFLKQSRSVLLSIGLFSSLVNILMLTGPLFMLQVYDRVLLSHSIPTLVALVVLVAVLYGFMAVLEVIRSRLLIRIGVRFDSDLRQSLFDGWLYERLRPSIKGGRKSPLQDLDVLRQFIGGNAPIALFDLPWVPFYLFLVFSLHWTLGVLAVVGALVVAIIALLNEVMTRKHFGKGSFYSSQAQEIAQQTFRHAESAHVMGMKNNLRQEWNKAHEESLESQLVAQDRAGGFTAASKVFRLFLQSMILAVGATLAIEQLVTPGVMIAASILTGRALGPVDQTIAQWKGVLKARQALLRTKRFLDEHQVGEDKTLLPSPKGKMSLRNVSVAGNASGKMILSDVNFDLDIGDGLGVIGPSASGKSTLARLLTGAWTPSRGEIRLDGATYGQWDSDVLGEKLGYLPQAVELFRGTVKQNIARFNENASDELVIEAAQSAGVHDMILKFEKGYETPIGEDGFVLSGGQKQRIALARALYGKPVLLVLDEPNSNLDAEGDQALTQAIISARNQGAVVVVIAHRPSTLEGVNKVLMLKDGEQMSFGPKDEVLRKVLENKKDPGKRKTGFKSSEIAGQQA